MKKLILSLLFFLAFINVFAQTQFLERTVIDQSSNTDGAKSAFTIDIDGDGDMDVATASYEDNKIAWYENLDGLGSFGHQQIVTTDALGANKVFAIDIDSDGDADLLSSSELDNIIAWYENTDGLGSYGPKQIITNLADEAQSVFAADLDGDGDVDVLSASKNDGEIAWYENTDGKGAFGQQQIITDQADGAKSVYAGDLDGDGDMDVLYSNDSIFYDENIAWFENLDGNATFGNLQIVHTSNHKQPREVMAKDINGDGYLDIMFSTGSGISWYGNIDGTGNFDYEHKIVGSLSQGSFFPKDINADGVIDLIGASAHDDKIVWYQGTGNGTFTTEVVITNKVQQPEAVLAEDFDNDGRVDVLSVSFVDDKVVWFKNLDGWGTFGLQKSISRNAMWANNIYPTDIDGDGDLDILVQSGLDSKVSWFENIDGQGTFGLQKVITNSLIGASQAFPFDADGDGDIDILATSRYRALGWYENLDGKGTFTDGTFHFKHFIDSPSGTLELNAADLDNDGNIDVVTDIVNSTYRNNTIHWYSNFRGNGDFGGDQQLGVSSDETIYSIRIADINGDSNLDIIKASYFDDVVAWHENTGISGTGRFNIPNVISDGSETKRGIAAEPADIDGDGDLDIVTAQQWLYNDDRIYWFENTDGQGTFSLGGNVTQFSKGIKAIFSADMDGDGDNDVLAASSADNSIKWYENFNGAGAFTNGHVLTSDAQGPTDVKAADFNGDGKLDVIASSGTDGKISWFQNIGTLDPNDPDGDGVLSAQETADNTDPDDGCSYLESSQDTDLISIIWEEEDCDNDGILNGVELANGSDPRNEDSDGDGVLDGDDSNPINSCIPFQDKDYTGYDANSTIWAAFDCDGDEVLNGDELVAGTNPYYNEPFHADSQVPVTFIEHRVEASGHARSIATNGTTVAVGKTGNPRGRVEIYSKDNNGVWQEVQVLSPIAPNSSFGWSVAMYGDTVLVGQPFADENEQDTVLVYQRGNDGIWVETQQLQASSDFTYDGFGHAISISENTLVIGADGIAPSGAAYVFEKDGSNLWTETAELYPSDELFEGGFGNSVAVAKDQIIIGGPGYDQTGAFIFEKQDDGSWQEIQLLGAQDGQNFTYAKDVAIIENRLIIGDVGYTDLIYDQGQSYIYERQYDGQWTPIQILEGSNGFQEDHFGDALAMNSNRIVVNMSADQTLTGWLNVFHKTGGEWIETDIFTDPEGSVTDFGYRVAVADSLIVATSSDFVHFFEDADHQNLTIESTEVTVISCFGQQNGKIEVQAIGGTHPYTYELFQAHNSTLITSGSSNTFENLPPGSYYVVVSDSNSDQVQGNTVTITEPEYLAATIEVQGINCNDSNDANATIEAQGGIPPYEFSIDNGVTFQATNVFENLVAGNYIAVVSDNNGCQVDLVFEIGPTVNTDLEINATDASCDDNDGSITITIPEYPEEYLFQINGGDLTSQTTYSDLSAGTYEIGIQHSNGCQSIQSIMISGPEDCDEFSLPTTNFTVQTTNETCASSNNGSILITAVENLNYTATLTGDSINLDQAFSTFTSFQNLEAGSYEICLTVTNEPEFEKCFSVQISEPEALDIDAVVDTSGKLITLKMKGGSSYTITLNDTEYSTTEDRITLPISKTVNGLSVKTDLDCQGVHEETILATFNSVSIYPNPVEKGDLTVFISNMLQGKVELLLFNDNGVLVAKENRESNYGTVKINVDGLPSGVYSLRISTEQENYVRRIIKK